jgi:hypothetical protein
VSGGVGQTKGHHQILIKTVSGGESSLWDIFFTDLDLMIARTKVNLRKDMCSNQLIEQEINVRQWILVLHGYCVEWSIIDAQPLGLVLLRHKNSRATLWITVGSDIPLIEQFLQLGLQFCHLILCHRIWPLIHKSSTRLQLGLEFDGPISRHSRQIIGKHIRIFTDHVYLTQTLGNSSIDRCREASDRWQLQRNLAIDRRVEVNQTRRDVQHNSMYLHPVHTKNDIDLLAIQDDVTPQNSEFGM